MNGIPPIYENISNKIITGYPSEIKKYLTNYFKDIDSFYKDGIGLALFGESGSGKTSIGILALKYFSEKYIKSYFLPYISLNFSNYLSLLKSVNHYKVLMIDGITESNRDILNTVESFVANRVQNGQLNILTFNIQNLNVINIDRIKGNHVALSLGEKSFYAISEQKIKSRISSNLC